MDMIPIDGDQRHKNDKVFFIVAESEWLNVEVLRSNIHSIGKEKHTRIVKEGK